PFAALRWGWLPFSPQRRATGSAEFSRQGILRSTLQASVLQRHATLMTKLSPCGVVKATIRTAHAASLLLWAPRGKEKAGSQAGGALLPVSGPLGAGERCSRRAPALPSLYPWGRLTSKGMIPGSV